MKRSVELGKPEEIIFIPERIEDEIIQNMGLIVALPQGTAPLLRTLGTSTESQGMPEMVGKAILTRDVFQSVQEQEPRVTLHEVDMTRKDGSGRYTAVMEVEISG